MLSYLQNTKSITDAIQITSRGVLMTSRDAVMTSDEIQATQNEKYNAPENRS